jgi:crotonobetainyl-CoA:carnitine CoA-transferase CaiB-like acyl-CoA transferase
VESALKPLDGVCVLTLAVNLPGPLAAARLRDLGAAVLKVEPPAGDPLAGARPRWYRALHEGVEAITLDLKQSADRARLEAHLAASDLLLTATRPAALARLGLGWQQVHARHRRLCQVAITGYGPPHEDRPGHDLNYQARAGLVVPPQLPRTCLADLAGAQLAVSAALALLLARERGRGAGHAAVSLAEAAAGFAEPLRHGVTTPDGILGGSFAGYDLYRARAGWVALAALEPHFWERLSKELGAADRERLREVFQTRTAADWEEWAAAHDLPLVAVREAADVAREE